METRTYTLTGDDLRGYLADKYDREFLKRSLATDEKPGTRIELYTPDNRLLEAYVVS